MDRELIRMKEQIKGFCNVELRRIPCQNQKNKPQPKQNDDSLLLLGLILILAMDHADKTLMLMLL